MISPRGPLGRRLYLDTNLYIYLLEGIEPYRQRMADLTAEIDRQDIRGDRKRVDLHRASAPPPQGRPPPSG